MSELKATPGPWFAEHSSVIGLDDEIVTTCVVGSVYRGDDAEDYATAHLIAAAPELFEALQKMVKMASTGMVDFNPHDEFVMSSARAALAKARGDL